jgi:hypothetical protein
MACRDFSLPSIALVKATSSDSDGFLSFLPVSLHHVDLKRRSRKHLDKTMRFAAHFSSVSQMRKNNPFPLLLNVPQILKTGVHLQFQKISDWPI